MKGRWSYADEGSVRVLGGARLYRVKLFNLKRKREQRGTATLSRLQAILAGIEKRHPGAVQSAPSVMPMEIRTRKAGPIVALIGPFARPARGTATKQ